MKPFASISLITKGELTPTTRYAKNRLSQYTRSLKGSISNCAQVLLRLMHRGNFNILNCNNIYFRGRYSMMDNNAWQITENCVHFTTMMCYKYLKRKITSIEISIKIKVLNHCTSNSENVPNNGKYKSLCYVQRKAQLSTADTFLPVMAWNGAPNFWNHVQK